MKPWPTSLRLAVVAAALLLALGLVRPLTAGAQAGAGGDDRIPSELWRTYPLTPGDGVTTIERADAPAPAPSTGAQTVPAGEPAPGGERPSADSESSSRAGAVVILALCALGVLASLLALLVFPAEAAIRTPARWTGFGSSTRNALGQLQRIQHRASAGLRHWSEVATRPILARRPAGIGPAPVRAVPPSPHARNTLPPSPSTGGREPGEGRSSQKVEKLKAKTLAGSEKERKRIADAEAQTLKRKLSTETGRNALKAKQERAVEPLERTSALPKASPAGERGTARAEEPAAAQPPLRPAPEHHLRRDAALRPVGGREPPPRARLVAVELPPECRIIWWRGYVKSRFIAIAEPNREGNAVIAASPFFRWRRAEPPPETPEIAQALGTLVEGLEQRGWRVSRRGRRWFSVHMQLTFGEEFVQTRQFEGPEAGRKGTMS